MLPVNDVMQVGCLHHSRSQHSCMCRVVLANMQAVILAGFRLDEVAMVSMKCVWE